MAVTLGCCQNGRPLTNSGVRFRRRREPMPQRSRPFSGQCLVSLRPYRDRYQVPAFRAVYGPSSCGSKLIAKFLEGILELLSYTNRFGGFQVAARRDKPI